jgi:LysM repeat protein
MASIHEKVTLVVVHFLQRSQNSLKTMMVVIVQNDRLRWVAPRASQPVHALYAVNGLQRTGTSPAVAQKNESVDVGN